MTLCMCGVCSDWMVPRWLMAAQKCSTGASGQIKARPLMCFNRRLCISLCLCACLRVCVRACVDVCELLASFIPAAVCWNACVLFCRACVRVVCLRSNRLCHLLPFPCACAHVDTLSLTALYVPTRGTPYPPQPLCVYWADTQYTPFPTSRARMCREGNPVSAFLRGETRHVFIPPPFPLIRPGAVHLTVVWGHARLRTGVQSFTHAGCPTSFSSWYSLWRGCFWKHCQKKEKKSIAGGCQGMYAGSFYVWRLWCMLHGRNTRIGRGGKKEALDVLKDQFCLLVTEFKINPICIFHILKASYLGVRII